ncbi:Myotubularin-related protein 8 [Blattella germanica]|nr:Myotubularin-related protein 8 [Blattella germanica]
MSVVLQVENVRMLDRYNARKPSIGTLYLTTTHLIFVDPDGKKETWIRCKTFLSVTFVVPRERDCHEVFVTLQQLAQPIQIEALYCFHYTSSTEDIPKPAGWNFFDLQSEYQRMGVPSDQWSLTLLNKDYELCDTYPRYLYVPSSASTTVLLGSSRFRSKGRLPVLSYLHRNKAAICRCSQPLSGFSARCLEDEQMLNCVLRTNPNNSYMYVVDTRPRINAMANRAAGKGYENENFYENIKFHFLGIENIHVMRSSLAKLIETCELKSPSMSSFLGGVESSGWLRHIRSILETSWFIAQAVDEKGISVVALIEKDWLAFGHKFSDRCGYVEGDPKEVSPVFTQFIDCTWQLAQQFPATFQFNERFLLTLHDHRINCLKQQLAECGDNKRNFPAVPLDGTIDSLKGVVMDNKYLYEKCREDGLASNLTQLKINNGMPGDATKLQGDGLSVDQLTAELASVALDWKTLRNIRECGCTTPFDHFSRKYHCWKCGEVFCTRCIDKHTSLPGHLSQRAVPVCRPCYREIRHSGSVESP